MEYRTLGNSGLQVSLSGIGTNSFGLKMDEAEVTAVVHEALDQGVTLFDTADHYSEGAAETLIGKALGTRRHQAIIASKFGWNMDGVTYQAKGSRHYMHWAVEQSLRRLNTATSISTSTIDPTTSRRSKRRWTRSTTSSVPERCATRVAPTSRVGASPTPTGRREAGGRAALCRHKTCGVC